MTVDQLIEHLKDLRTKPGVGSFPVEIIVDAAEQFGPSFIRELSPEHITVAGNKLEIEFE